MAATVVASSTPESCRCWNCGKKFAQFAGNRAYQSYYDTDLAMCERCLSERHDEHYTEHEDPLHCPSCRAEEWVRRVRLNLRAARLFVYKLSFAEVGR